MKATLEFALPEDQADFELASHAGEMYRAITDTRDEIRKRLKYGTPSKATAQALEEIRAVLLRDLNNLMERIP